MDATLSLLEWRLDDLLPNLERISVSGQGTLSKYRYNNQVYMIKSQAYPKPVQRELEFLQTAADISVQVKGHVLRNKNNDDLMGFIMPYLVAIKPSKMTSKDKLNLFRQISGLIPQQICSWF